MINGLDSIKASKIWVGMFTIIYYNKRIQSHLPKRVIQQNLYQKKKKKKKKKKNDLKKKKKKKKKKKPI